MYDTDFFEWLRKNNKLDKYEAMLDTIEDFKDLELNLKASSELDELKQQYKLHKIENGQGIKRSNIWKQIYEIVTQLELKECDCDRMDKPSCTTELELLFNKLFISETKATKSTSNGKM